jgi:hypothetical protein
MKGYDWEGKLIKWLWATLKYYFSICLEIVGETSARIHSFQAEQPPKYKVALLPPYHNIWYIQWNLVKHMVFMTILHNLKCSLTKLPFCVQHF